MTVGSGNELMPQDIDPVSSPENVLDFWFGDSSLRTLHAPRSVWWKKDAAFDARVRSRFLRTVEEARRTGLYSWRQQALTSLAFIIVCDQFSRNMFRGLPQAFSLDTLALDCARAMVDTGADQGINPVARLFVYMPFEHSECLADQEQSVRLIGALGADSGADDSVDYAIRHHAVIARFGRFPHRNSILGRDSSADEIEFLRQPGSRF